MTDIIIERALVEYVDLYGKSERDEIMERTKNSKLFGNNLDTACQRQVVFSGTSINQIVGSAHWKFSFAPKRKIYFASLLFLLTLYKKFEHSNIVIREEDFLKSLDEIQENFKKML